MYFLVSFSDYHCGSVLAWSPGYKFTTFPDGFNWSPRLAVFGDLGLINAQSIPQLTKDVKQGMYDAILHVGDFAYDMNDVSLCIMPMLLAE